MLVSSHLDWKEVPLEGFCCKQSVVDFCVAALKSTTQLHVTEYKLA